MSDHTAPPLTDEQHAHWRMFVAAMQRWLELRRISTPEVSPLTARAAVTADARLAWLEKREADRRGVQITHSAECWRWHLDCAVKKVEELRAERKRLVDALDRVLTNYAGYATGSGDDFEAMRREMAALINADLILGTTKPPKEVLQ